jgi:Tol biopolymer transport system component
MSIVVAAMGGLLTICVRTRILFVSRFDRCPGWLWAASALREEIVRKGLLGAGLTAALWVAGPTTAMAAVDYSTASFKETTNGYAYGQAPVFMPDGKRVLFGNDFKDGNGNQVYISDFPTGANRRCLTCTGPGSGMSNVNGVPAVRPQGDWILFHSWRGHYFTFGSPGYGGFGTALWVMHPDGSDQTQITETQPQFVTNSSDPSTFGADEGYDDYHAYWSPDGTHVEWAHFDGNIPTAGVGKWDVRVGEFAVRDGKPMLTNIHVVRPANGHWYETQWWAPDGSGFLYTETSDGMDIPHLFFCRLIDNDSACQVTQLTHNAAWDEQALFTPDMKEVIFMSSRDQPGLFNTWAQTTQTLGLPNDYDWLLILPLFEAGYLQPVGQEYTDLYELDLATGSVRRLTTDGQDGWITPEFAWDPKGKFLMWTENRFPDGYRYPFPPNAGQYAQSLQQLAQNPPSPNQDVTPSGTWVAPIPWQQRTQIGVFETGSPATSALRLVNRRSAKDLWSRRVHRRAPDGQASRRSKR